MSDIKTVREHLKDLKKVFVKIFLFGLVLFFLLFLVSERIIIFLINYMSLELVALAPLEFIRTQLVLSAYLTLALLLPFILVQVYLFSKPVLKKESRRKSVLYFLYSFCLAIIGFLFGVFFFSRFSLGFFAQLPAEISAFWGVYSVILFIVLSGFAFALTMQIIIIIPVLVKLGLVDIKTLKKSRGIVLILALTISAILTSPDPLTQILMSAPMYICFEAGLLISHFQKK
jgi:sec-independent protein translocase protein TatC